MGGGRYLGLWFYFRKTLEDGEVGFGGAGPLERGGCLVNVAALPVEVPGRQVLRLPADFGDGPALSLLLLCFLFSKSI